MPSTAVRPLTRRIWNAVREAGLPSLVFINKMDREPRRLRHGLQRPFRRARHEARHLYMPIVDGDAFTGIVDILGGKASCSAKTAP